MPLLSRETLWLALAVLWGVLSITSHFSPVYVYLSSQDADGDAKGNAPVLDEETSRDLLSHLFWFGWLAALSGYALALSLLQWDISGGRLVARRPILFSLVAALTFLPVLHRHSSLADVMGANEMGSGEASSGVLVTLDQHDTIRDCGFYGFHAWTFGYILALALTHWSGVGAAKQPTLPPARGGAP